MQKRRGEKGRKPKMLFHHLDSQGWGSLKGGPTFGGWQLKIPSLRTGTGFSNHITQPRRLELSISPLHLLRQEMFCLSARSPHGLAIPGEWGYPSKCISVATTVPSEPLSSSPGAIRDLQPDFVLVSQGPFANAAFVSPARAG